MKLFKLWEISFRIATITVTVAIAGANSGNNLTHAVYLSLFSIKKNFFKANTHQQLRILVKRSERREISKGESPTEMKRKWDGKFSLYFIIMIFRFGFNKTCLARVLQLKLRVRENVPPFYTYTIVVNQ